MRVVTYQSPRGGRISLCQKCEDEIKASGKSWPKDGDGQEYCQVHYGLHSGQCDRCKAQRSEGKE